MTEPLPESPVAVAPIHEYSDSFIEVPSIQAAPPSELLGGAVLHRSENP